MPEDFNMRTSIVILAVLTRLDPLGRSMLVQSPRISTGTKNNTARRTAKTPAAQTPAMQTSAIQRYSAIEQRGPQKLSKTKVFQKFRLRPAAFRVPVRSNPILELRETARDNAGRCAPDCNAPAPRRTS